MRRLQRQRTPGWRMPEGAVYVGRPTVYGNPFSVPEYRRRLKAYPGSEVERREHQRAVDNFRGWLTGPPSTYWTGEESRLARAGLILTLPRLRGKDLVCWCRPDLPCHADVLIELANTP